jgi:hypothetical protein
LTRTATGSSCTGSRCAPDSAESAAGPSNGEPRRQNTARRSTPRSGSATVGTDRPHASARLPGLPRSQAAATRRNGTLVWCGSPYEATFGAPHRASSRIGALALKQELITELSGLPSPFVLQGFGYIGHRPLQVDGPAGRSECTFAHASNGEHSGWCRDIGFALTVSKSKRAGNVWVHELAAFTVLGLTAW